MCIRDRDTGDRFYTETLFHYLDPTEVKTIDYLILTHPHADHIGSAADVLYNYEVGLVVMPGVAHTTKTFENLLDAIESTGVNALQAEAGQVLINENDLLFENVAPVKDNYDGLNDWSVTNRIEYGETSFLFTGDIEYQSERDLVDSGANIETDVLKVSHHGSSSSSNDFFLEKVFTSNIEKPIAIISAGKENRYGHPHSETMEKLNTYNAEVLLSHDTGDIVIVSDGENISVDY